MASDNRERGVVLVMVLIVLVALMLIGVGVMRTTGIENRIAGNELRYQRDFYTAEGASDYVVAEFDELMYNHNLDKGQSVALTDQLPTNTAIRDATVKIELKNVGAPPVGSGSSAAYATTNYYTLESKRHEQLVEVGLWRSFPTAQ